ncbi:MAG: transcriptional repressor LexA [Treponema sp.]|nr:transcriptional repressor LexA [Treponema sp.]
MKELTHRQKEVLSFIAEYIGDHSYPPTIREVAEYFSISVKGAHDHIIALKKKGSLKQAGKRSRTIEVVGNNGPVGCLAIPLLGTVAAGRPILAEENWDGTITIHQSMLRKNKKHFALKVRGDSMTGAGIMDGDTAIIEKQETCKNGEIVVVVVDEAVALKRVFREKTRLRIQSENPAYKTMYSQKVRILGRLVQILRSY